MPYSQANWDYLYGLSEVPPTPEEYARNTRYRDRTVLFGDAGAAVVIRAHEEDSRGVIDSILRTDGSEYDKLIVPGVGFKRRPYVDAGQIARGEPIPIVEGRAG